MSATSDRVDHDEVRRIVEALALSPHPEGGFYRETERTERLTSMAFLLPEGSFSALHRVVGADEVWCHHAGADVTVTTLVELAPGQVAGVQVATLGRAAPQLVVHANVWQSAAPVGGWALCGCIVAPPFTFERLEMPSRDELLARFPAHRALVERLTR